MSHSESAPTIEDVAAELAELRDEVDSLRDENAELRAEVDDLREENTALREQVTEQSERISWSGSSRSMENLRIDGIPVGFAIEQRREEISALQAKHEQQSVQPDTELGVGLQMDPSAREDAYGVTKQRAVTIAETLPAVAGDEGARVDASLKRRVEGERGESLAWVQLYRACDALETMSDGALEWDDSGETKHILINDRTVLRA